MGITIPIHANLKADATNYRKAQDFIDGDVVSPDYIVPYSTDYTYNENGQVSGVNRHYTDRVRRSYNVNMTEAVLEQHRTTLAQPMAVSEEAESEELANFLANVDGEGTTLDDFVREVLFAYGGLGTCAVLTEAPVITDDIGSRLNEGGHRPYWRLYDATSVRYWERFEFEEKRGQLRQVILENEPTVDSNGKYRRNFRWYYFGDSSSYSVRELQSEPLDSLVTSSWGDDEKTEYNVISDEVNPGGLTEIPVVILGGKHKDSFTWRIWPLNHALLNRLSVLTNINYHHGFPKVFVTGVTDNNELKKGGEYVVNSLTNPASKVMQLQPGNPQAVFEEIRMIMHNIKLIAGFKLTQLTADDTRQVQSAESKAKDLQLLANFYNDTALYLERKMGRAVNHAGVFLGLSTELSLQIGRDFGLEDDDFDLTMDELVLNTVTAYFDETSANEVVKAITTRRLSDMRIVGVGEESEEETRARLKSTIENAQPRASAQRSLRPVDLTPLDEALS